MAYNIDDLLDKAIAIAEKRKKIYEQVEFKDSEHIFLNIFIKVIAKNIQKDIENYKVLKENITHKHEEIIDFVTYDKISFLFNKFQIYLIEPDIQDPISFIKFSLGMEEKIYALFIDIQGRLVKNKEDAKTEVYRTIEEILAFKRKRIEELSALIKN